MVRIGRADGAALLRWTHTSTVIAGGIGGIHQEQTQMWTGAARLTDAEPQVDGETHRLDKCERLPWMVSDTRTYSEERDMFEALPNCIRGVLSRRAEDEEQSQGPY